MWCVIKWKTLHGDLRCRSRSALWGNRLVSVTGAATAGFVYDGDGKQVKATVNGITTVYVGNHYEVKNGTVTKYYFAGATRLAVRTDGTLRFLLGDHLGSSSVTTDANGVPTASALYKAFGETRYTDGNLGTDYRFTGQREEASLGIYFFQARWYDGSLGRFLSPDSLVPTSTQGTQAWDRYAFVNNNPVRYTDPTGHSACKLEPEECEYLASLNGGSSSGGISGSSSGNGTGNGGGGQPSNSPSTTNLGVGADNERPLCQQVTSYCDTLYEASLTYDQLHQLYDLLHEYSLDLGDLQWKVAGVGVLSAIAKSGWCGTCWSSWC